jgi:serine/threonine protein kinase
MSDLTGKIIAGRYRVDEFIGRGGMAEVYKVWDTRRNTALAMKLLHADLALDRAFIRRFHREAETLSRLQHPNIVRLYGLEQDGEQIFMLVDFIEGKSLKQLIFNSDGPLPFPHVQEIMRQLCQALQFAHYEGFVHADVKPGNVLIDRSGRVMLNDFGIARMAQTGTATLGGAGTPAYMSPEQVRSEQPGAQSDIYSLGVLLFEMLTGERPFNGEQAVSGGTIDDRVRWEQLKASPPWPHELNPQVSATLEQVVLKALEKNPAQRYAGALELSDALDLALGPEAVVRPGESISALGEQASRADKTRRRSNALPGGLSKSMLSSVRLIAVVILLGLSAMLAFLWNGSFFVTTPSAVPTATRQQAPTSTPSRPSATPSPTGTPLPADTSTPVATGTSTIPLVSAIDVPINCRYGPGTQWQVVSALTLGTDAEIIGKDSELNYGWWQVRDPLNPGAFCWVALSVTNATGNLPLVQVVAAPTAQVTRVTVNAEPAFIACGEPNAVAFAGRITANGPATVTYRWELRGEQQLTTSPEAVAFDNFGTRTVSYAGDYAADCGNYQISLRVLTPNEALAQHDFTIRP